MARTIPQASLDFVLALSILWEFKEDSEDIKCVDDGL